jgi:chromate transporter
MADLATKAPEAPDDASPPAQRPLSSAHLFWAFTWLAMQGFGGVLAVAQKELCDRRRWLTHTEFLALLSTAQVMPGPNVCNLSIMIGDRFFGWRGACAALGGMIALPMALMLVLAWVVGQTPPASEAHTMVQGALRGIAAVAGGQIIGTVLRLSKPLLKHPMGWWWAVGFAAAAFLMMAVMHWSLVWVLLGLGLLACVWTGWQLNRQAHLQAKGPA